MNLSEDFIAKLREVIAWYDRGREIVPMPNQGYGDSPTQSTLVEVRITEAPGTGTGTGSGTGSYTHDEGELYLGRITWNDYGTHYTDGMEVYVKPNNPDDTFVVGKRYPARISHTAEDTGFICIGYAMGDGGGGGSIGYTDATHEGIISLSDQVIGDGVKQFQDPIYLLLPPSVSANTGFYVRQSADVLHTTGGSVPDQWAFSVMPVRSNGHALGSLEVKGLGPATGSGCYMELRLKSFYSGLSPASVPTTTGTGEVYMYSLDTASMVQCRNHASTESYAYLLISAGESYVVVSYDTDTNKIQFKTNSSGIQTLLRVASVTYLGATGTTGGGDEVTAGFVTSVYSTKMKRVAVPSTSSSTGTVGDIAFDSSYVYICHATNTWKRVAVATW